MELQLQYSDFRKEMYLYYIVVLTNTQNMLQQKTENYLNIRDHIEIEEWNKLTMNCNFLKNVCIASKKCSRYMCVGGMYLFSENV